MVMDTNVVVSGLRSPSGASARLIDQALARTFTPLLSVALALEYEATRCDPAQLSASGLSEPDVQTIIEALCSGGRSFGIRLTRWSSKRPSMAPLTCW